MTPPNFDPWASYNILSLVATHNTLPLIDLHQLRTITFKRKPFQIGLLISRLLEDIPVISLSLILHLPLRTITYSTPALSKLLPLQLRSPPLSFIQVFSLLLCSPDQQALSSHHIGSTNPTNLLPVSYRIPPSSLVLARPTPELADPKR